MTTTIHQVGTVLDGQALGRDNLHPPAPAHEGAKSPGVARKTKPFKTVHTFGDPDNAIDFYEEQVQLEFPDPVVDFLYAVAEAYPDALFNVQPAVTTNYIAIARAGDRKSWAFVKPDKIAIWVAHSRNAEALCRLHDELTLPLNPTRWTRHFVDVIADKAAEEGPEVAIEFAASFAKPYPPDDEDGPERFA